MADYSLETGNGIERNLAPLLREYFPLYNDFRSAYLIPLTGLPEDPNWRIDTHPELERIGISSFGILKSINFIFIKKNQIHVSGDPDQTFKNIYFHFGLAIDCVEALARSISIIESELKITNIDKRIKLPFITLILNYVKWAINDYTKSYNEMISNGKPIFYYPQHDNNFLSIVVKNKSARKSYSRLTKQLKDYRNFFIHNPGVDIFMDTGTRKRYALQKGMVLKSKNWATVKELYRIDKTVFIDPTEMVEKDLHSLLSGLNSIWTSFTENMELIYTNHNFIGIFKGFRRELLPEKQ